MINRNIYLAVSIAVFLASLTGCPWTRDPSYIDTGFSGRPQPATGGSGQWKELSGTGGVRDTHTALWIIGYTDKGITGRMLIWGGRGIGGYLNSGSIWNQTTSEWTTTTLTGAPSARNSHTAIWTGAEMIIFGGRNTSGILNDGGMYSRASDSWIATSAPTRTQGNITFQTIAARVGHVAVWSGSRMIVFGGFGGFWESGQGAVNNPAYLGDVQMYIPEFNTWLNGSTSGAPSGRWLHTAVWTDTEMIVWGGSNPAYLNTGARYNPTNDTWTSMATTGAPVGRERHTALWTGTGTEPWHNKMIVWGGVNPLPTNTGGMYDATLNMWMPITTTDAPSPRYNHTMIWTGGSNPRLVVWGGVDASAVPQNTGGLYDMVTDTWESSQLSGAPKQRQRHSAVWTGQKMIIYGGYGGDDEYFGDAWEYTPPVQ